MADDLPSTRATSLAFQEQQAFFRGKVNLPTAAWTDIVHEGHDQAFVVAGAMRDGVLKDFRAAVDKAISQGTTLAEFRKDFDAIVEKHGWQYNGGRNWRSKVIYETNLRASYMAGRYQQLQATKKLAPFWKYVHSDFVAHPRLQHKAWSGLTLSADDPWWDMHFPPNGWGCQCRVTAQTRLDLRKAGKTGPDTAPPVELETVTIGARGPSPREVEVPKGVDPGWGYAPGRSSWLKQQALRSGELVAEQAKLAWKPLTPGNAASYGRPVKVPVDAPVAELGPQARSKAEAREMIAQAIGGATKLFDAKGLPVVVSAEYLGEHFTDMARTRYIPFLPELLADPFEIWASGEVSSRGDFRVRARILKILQLKGKRSLVMVADYQAGIFVGYTYFHSGDPGYLDALRAGVLLYGR